MRGIRYNLRKPEYGGKVKSKEHNCQVSKHRGQFFNKNNWDLYHNIVDNLRLWQRRLKGDCRLFCPRWSDTSLSTMVWYATHNVSYHLRSLLMITKLPLWQLGTTVSSLTQWISLSKPQNKKTYLNHSHYFLHFLEFSTIY